MEVFHASPGHRVPAEAFRIGLAQFPALIAHLVQRGADAIVVQHLFGFRSAVLESKFVLNVRGVAKISRERQPLRHGKTIFFAVLDHTVVHSTESGRSRNPAVGLR
jgi:hypothetical protein